MGSISCGWLAIGLCLLGAAPASAKDVYDLSLPKYLTGFWHVSVLDSLALEQGYSQGHLEFEKDTQDRDALIADYCEKPSESSRRQIRDSAPANDKHRCGEGYLPAGHVRVKLTSSTAGTLEYKTNGAESFDQILEFKFDPNSNRLHTAQGAVFETAQELGFSAYQATVIAANHLQLTGYGGMDGDDPVMATLSAKKGVANKDQETFISKWGPSALVVVFFIGSKFLRKKFGQGSDYMKERQSMPVPRKMPPAAQKAPGAKKSD